MYRKVKKKQFAKRYKVSRQTIYNWLNRAFPEHEKQQYFPDKYVKYYSGNQVSEIYKRIGEP